MATTYYVDDGGSDTNPYDTWAKAATTLAGLLADITIAAGDTILIGHDHNEVSNGAKTWTIKPAGSLVNPVRLVSANTSTSAYEAGAALGAADANNVAFDCDTGGIDCYGLALSSNGAAVSLGDNKATLYFTDCTFTCARIYLGAGDACYVRMLSCTMTFSYASYCFYANSVKAIIDIVDCAITNAEIDSADELISLGTADGVTLRVVGCDFSGAPGGYVFNDLADTVVVSAARCILHADTTALVETVDSSTLGTAVMEHCLAGTQTVPVYQYWKQTSAGSVKADATRTRTNGATDGETPYTLEFASSASCCFGNPLEGPPLRKWVAAGSQTITVYCTASADLYNDEFWIEVSSPSEAATATSLAVVETTKMTVLGTHAELTQDDSSWSGAGVGSGATGIHKISVTIAPTEAGYVEVRCSVGKASTTVYVDPEIASSGTGNGNTWMAGGAAVIEGAASGGGGAKIIGG